MMPLEVVATDAGRVCVSGKKDFGYHVALYDAEDSFKALYQSKQEFVPSALCLSADQAEVYLSPRTAAATFNVSALPTKGAKPTPSVLAQLEEATTATRELTASPDGVFLLNQATGMTLRMPKAPKK